jgi:hypothetical protein
VSNEFREGIKALSVLNPNKFSVLEVLALDRIENKLHESLSWMEISLRRHPEKKTDTHRDSMLYHRLLLNCCERLSSSHMLRPVMGHVIQRDRKLIAKYVKKAEGLATLHNWIK